MSNKIVISLLATIVFAALTACDSSDGNRREQNSATLSLDMSPVTNVEAATIPDNPVSMKLGIEHRGEATFYRATGKGNCSFDASKNLMVAAINSKDYAGAAMCGAYIAVSGPKGKVTVRITDRCPGCKAGGLDLSREAFARIAAKAAGRVPVTWKIVAGPISGPVEYHYMKGTTRYWTAIQVRNHRWPIVSLEILPKGGRKWLRVERRVYNYFVYPKPIAAGPVRVRITALTGTMLEDKLPEPKGGLLIHGASQF